MFGNFGKRKSSFLVEKSPALMWFLDVFGVGCCGEY